MRAISRYRGIVVGLLGLALSVGGVVNQVPEAQAVSFDINTCRSSCTGLPNVTVATLDIVQNGAHVDFTLVNSVGNLGGFAVARTVISQFFSSYTGDSLVAGDFSVVSGGATGGFALGDRNNTGLDFNLLLDVLQGNKNTFIHGETLNWTVANDSVANFTSGLNGQSQFLMVHIQMLANDDSTKYVNGNSTSVPEPASLLLLGAGLAGIGIWRRKSAKS